MTFIHDYVNTEELQVIELELDEVEWFTLFNIVFF